MPLPHLYWEEVADRFLDVTRQTLDLLAANTEMGNALSVRKLELKGLRKFPVGSGFKDILLFYFPVTDGIELVRVIHGSRDLRDLFR